MSYTPLQAPSTSSLWVTANFFSCETALSKRSTTCHEDPTVQVLYCIYLYYSEELLPEKHSEQVAAVHNAHGVELQGLGHVRIS